MQQFHFFDVNTFCKPIYLPMKNLFSLLFAGLLPCFCISQNTQNGDSSKPTLQIKPEEVLISPQSKNNTAENKFLFDSTGFSIIKNNMLLLKINDLPIDEGKNNPVLSIDPVSRQIKQRSLNPDPNYNVTSGTNGLSDYEALQTAIINASEGDNILLEDKTYVLTSGIFVNKSLNFIGKKNTVIKRCNEIVTTISQNTSISSNRMIVANAQNFRAGDAIILYKDSTAWGATNNAYINLIKNDTLFLNAAIGTFIGYPSMTQFDAGTAIKKSFNLIDVAANDLSPAYTCSFYNISFDGNRENNTSNYGYFHSWAISSISKRATRIENCSFYNMPTEAVVGHNFKVTNSSFHDINGSAIHFSISKQGISEADLYSEITNNVFTYTNQLSTATVTGHSEGVLTTSNSGGYFTCQNNRIANCGEAFIGALYPSLSADDYGTHKIICKNNYIENVKRLVYVIDVVTAGDIKGVYIDNNVLINPTENIDFEASLTVPGRTGIILQGFRSFEEATSRSAQNIVEPPASPLTPQWLQSAATNNGVGEHN